MSVPCAHSPGFRNPPPALAPFHPRLHVASARSRMTCRTKEDAMLYIAQIDQEGKGVPKDLEQAVAYRKVAAAPGAGLRPSSAPWGAIRPLRAEERACRLAGGKPIRPVRHGGEPAGVARRRPCSVFECRSMCRETPKSGGCTCAAVVLDSSRC